MIGVLKTALTALLELGLIQRFIILLYWFGGVLAAFLGRGMIHRT